MSLHNRDNPSPRYQELLSMYCTMHAEGDAQKGIAPENMFAGISLPPQAIRIKQMIDSISANSTLDYGCGKGMLYHTSPVRINNQQNFENIRDFWGVKETMLYDPAYTPYATLPTKKADLVICTDVMEHCPEQDIVWILQEVFSFAHKGIYLNIASYPAGKTLPNGENAHCTVRPQHWWQGALNYVSASFPEITWQCWLDVVRNSRKETILLQS